MNILRKALFWVLALVITMGAARYQRVSGPTYPIDGTASLGPTTFEYSIKRTHGGEDDHLVRIETEDETIGGAVIWKRFKYDEPLHRITMQYVDGALVAYLPHQPPAGKLEYQVRLQRGDEVITLPEDGPSIIRFKGAVPAAVLIPHIIFMFSTMLLSTRTILAVVAKERLNALALLTLILLGIGGMILGPIVQKYAFGAYWTGWPFGEDLTDNKTLVAFIAWALATWRIWKYREPSKGRWWAIAAGVILLAVYSIPHSMRGSELDYNTLPEDSLKASDIDTRTVEIEMEN